MPKASKPTLPRKRRCFCADCDGLSRPWSSWSRHQKLLAQKKAALEVEMGQVGSAPDPETALRTDPISSPTEILEKEFSQTKGKRQERIERIKTGLLGIHKEIETLLELAINLPIELVFSPPRDQEGAKGEWILYREFLEQPPLTILQSIRGLARRGSSRPCQSNVRPSGPGESSPNQFGSYHRPPETPP